MMMYDTIRTLYEYGFWSHDYISERKDGKASRLSSALLVLDHHRGSVHDGWAVVIVLEAGSRILILCDVPATKLVAAPALACR